jgi:hypothetical protein
MTMADRDELVRRVVAALRVSDDPSDQLHPDDYERLARAVLDALGLTEETVWTDNGDPEVQRNTPGFTVGADPYEERGPGEEFFRQHGWKHQRRWTTPWEEI